MSNNIKEFSSINGYRVKDPIARKKIDKIQLSDFVDCKVFAQVCGELVGFDMTTGSVQSFAIGDDILCACICVDSANNSKLITYNIRDGRVISYRDGLSLGHGNGMTYCDKDGYYYIACAGGQNGLDKIEVYDYMLTHIKTIDTSVMEHKKPFGIAWHKPTETFYYLSGMDIVNVTYDFELIKAYKRDPQTDPDITQQSCFATDDYLFLIWNNLENNDGRYNKLDAYHIDTMEYYKKQFVMSQMELEGCCEYDGVLYLMFTGSNCGVVCKGSLYEDLNTGNYIPKYLFGGSRISTTTAEDKYYVDSTYYEFFVDNTESRPFNKLYPCLNYIVKPTYKDRIALYLKGDFSNQTINFKHLQCNLLIKGYGSEYAKIGGVFLQNIGLVTLYNLNIVKKAEVQNAMLCLKAVKYAWISNIDFNGDGSEQDALWMVSTTGQIQLCNFNSDVSRNLINCVEGSYLIVIANNTFTGSGGFQLPDNCNLPYQFDINKAINNIPNRESIIGPTPGFDITKIRRPGKYRIEGGSGANATTSVNVPKPLETGSFAFEVENTNDLITYHVTQYGGNKFVGTYNTTTGLISWIGEKCYFEYELVDTSYITGGSIYLSTTDLKQGIITGSIQINSTIPANTAISALGTNHLIDNGVKYYIFGIDATGKIESFYYQNGKVYTHKAVSPTSGWFALMGVVRFSDIKFNV